MRGQGGKKGVRGDGHVKVAEVRGERHVKVADEMTPGQRGP